MYMAQNGHAVLVSVSMMPCITCMQACHWQGAMAALIAPYNASPIYCNPMSRVASKERCLG